MWKNDATIPFLFLCIYHFFCSLRLLVFCFSSAFLQLFLWSDNFWSMINWRTWFIFLATIPSPGRMFYFSVARKHHYYFDRFKVHFYSVLLVKKSPCPSQIIKQLGQWISNSSLIVFKIKDKQRAEVTYTSWTGTCSGVLSHTLVPFLTDIYFFSKTSFIFYGNQSSYCTWYNERVTHVRFLS